MYSSDCLGSVFKVQKCHCDSKSCPLPQTTHNKIPSKFKTNMKKGVHGAVAFSNIVERWNPSQLYSTHTNSAKQGSLHSKFSTWRNFTVTPTPPQMMSSEPKKIWPYERIWNIIKSCWHVAIGAHGITRKPSSVLLSCIDCVCKVPCMREKNDAMLVSVSFVWNACVSCNAWQLRALS